MVSKLEWWGAQKPTLMLRRMKVSSFWRSLATVKPHQAGEAELGLVSTTASYRHMTRLCSLDSSMPQTIFAIPCARKTIRAYRLLSANRKSLYAASIGTTTDDLEWPWMAVSCISRYLCVSWASCLSLLAFNSSPKFALHTHRSSRWNWKKTAGSRWTCGHVDMVDMAVSYSSRKGVLILSCDFIGFTWF